LPELSDSSSQSGSETCSQLSLSELNEDLLSNFSKKALDERVGESTSPGKAEEEGSNVGRLKNRSSGRVALGKLEDAVSSLKQAASRRLTVDGFH